MLRRVATFVLWAGLFALFLAFAAYSVGVLRLDLAFGGAAALLFAWLVLRRPPEPFQPDRRFRTLRRLGLLGSKGEDKK
jgi:hypothetical protein